MRVQKYQLTRESKVLDTCLLWDEASRLKNADTVVFGGYPLLVERCGCCDCFRSDIGQIFVCADRAQENIKEGLAEKAYIAATEMAHRYFLLCGKEQKTQ